eukprot:247524_1
MISGLLLLWIYYLLSTNAATTIFVSPNGNNNNNGLSPTTPFQSIQYTQTWIHKMKQNDSNNDMKFTVKLMDGTFYMEQALDMSFLDSNTTYESYESNSNQSIISNGKLIPSSCFKKISSINHIIVYQCNIKNFINNMTNKNFRSIRINNIRGTPVRYPKLHSKDSAYTDRYLFVDTVQSVTNQSGYIIGLANNKLPIYLHNDNASISGKVHLWPDNSLVNVEMNIISYPKMNNTQKTYSYFMVTCPVHIPDITKGNRLYFYNVSNIPITTENEWYYNKNSNVLYVSVDNNTNISDVEIVIPNNRYIISLNSSSNVIFNNISFMDNDYTAYGIQNGFNANNTDPDKGIPADGAIRINFCTNITFINCKFTELSSSGIIIGNGSNNIFITHNYFHNLGQSSILIVGAYSNDTTFANGSHPQFIYIENNTIVNVGQILASAAGVYGCSLSYSIIQFNNITNSSRWGIEIRQQGNAISHSNIIQYNRIHNTGMTTGNFGGISFSGHSKHANTSVMYNCIRNAIGINTNSKGNIFSPYFSFGVYLDNWSTGYYIYGNVMNKNELAGVFIHGGSDNIINNNIFYNTLENDDSETLYGQTALQQTQASKNGPTIKDNSFDRNVYFWHNPKSLLVFTNHNEFKPEWIKHDDYNLYYIPNHNIKQLNIPYFTPCGNTFNQWLNCHQKKYDQHSIVDVNPKFADVEHGNFTIKNGSVLLTKLNFEPIPDYIAANC